MSKKGNPHGLTDLQIKFCQEFVKDLNATRAYIRAGYKVSSSDAAGANAARLLANDRIQAYLGEIANLSEFSIIAEVVKIAFTKITDVIEYDGTNLKIKPSQEWSSHAKSAVKSITVTETEVKGKRTVVTQITMHDKLAALEKLMRKFKLYPKEVPLLDAVQLLLTEGVATSEQAQIISEGIRQIEEGLRTFPSASKTLES